MKHSQTHYRYFQRGSAAVEFALVSAFGGLLIALLGSIELGRVLFYLNTANEATRLGARLAVVCDANDSMIKSRMAKLLPLLQPEKISVSYSPSGCASSAENARNSCQSVTVAITGLQINTVIPFVPFSVTMPPFSTTLSREAMNSASCV